LAYFKVYEEGLAHGRTDMPLNNTKPYKLLENASCKQWKKLIVTDLLTTKVKVALSY
jgi:hypothetical protein